MIWTMRTLKSAPASRMKHFANVLNHFWRQWRSEYLNKLRESHQYAANTLFIRAKGTSSLSMIMHCHVGSGNFRQIQELFKGSDGLPRSALVRVSARRDQQHTLLKRPPQLLTETPEVLSENGPVPLQTVNIYSRAQFFI